VSVRCPASIDDSLRWVKQPFPATAAADDDDDDDGASGVGWVEVSTRRRLILDADTEPHRRDGVYLCILMSARSSSSSSSDMASLAANLTVISPCKHPHILTDCFAAARQRYLGIGTLKELF